MVNINTFFNNLNESFHVLKKEQKNFHLIGINIINYYTSKMLVESKAYSNLIEEITANLKKFLNLNFYNYEDKIIILIKSLDIIPFNIPQIINEIHQTLTNPSYANHFSIISPLVSYFSASYPEDILTLKDFLEKMEIVFEKAKVSRDKIYYTYQEAENLILEEISKNLKIEELKDHIRNKQLSLAFQDIVERKTGTISHYECLLRLIKSDGKFITVGPYIPLAEEYEFITSIDEIVLEFVAEEARKNTNISFSFNLSGPGIYNTNWLKRAKQLFKEYNIAKRIIIEITETSAKKDLGKAALFVVSLQELGCKVALDDFGSGYTSFRQLKALPVDYVKIDGAFIKDIVNNPDNYLFVKLLLEMSHGIGCKVIAEYVETAETAKVLMDLGIDYMQGNYFSPAVNYKPWQNKT